MAEPEPPAPPPGEHPAGDASNREDTSFAEAEFLDALTGWAAGQRTTGAAKERSRLRSLDEAAAGSATLTGILVDLAEREAELVVSVGPAGEGGGYPPAGMGGAAAGAGRLGGRLVGVGRDFCVIEQDNGRPAVVRTSALTGVWPRPLPGATRDTRPHTGSDARSSPLSLSFLAVLHELASERAQISAHTPSGRIDGELWAVGEDVVTLRVVAGGTRRAVHLPAGAVRYCELR